MIMVINGVGSAAMMLANGLRDDQVRQRKGVMLVHKDNLKDLKGRDVAVQHVIEKLIDGDAFVVGTAAGDVRWKKEPLAILVGAEGAAYLDQIEAACPGFKTVVGPVEVMKVGGA